MGGGRDTRLAVCRQLVAAMIPFAAMPPGLGGFPPHIIPFPRAWGHCLRNSDQRYGIKVQMSALDRNIKTLSSMD